MDSKSWTSNTFQCQASNRHLGRHTDPIIYAVEDCRLHGNNKTSKRPSEENLERASRRRRTASPCPSNDYSCSVFSLSDHTTSSSSGYTGSSDSTGETSSHSGSSNGPVLSSWTTSDVSEKGSRKRSRWSLTSAEDHNQTLRSSSSSSERPRKRRKTSQKAAFEAKYAEEELLGEGGFGSVFAGYRKDDNLPVAIKHICQSDVKYTSMRLDGKTSTVPLEVALLLKVKPAAGTSAVIALLDWYELDDELILILERPVPCMDLTDCIFSRGSGLQEHEAKLLTKQLVDALIEVQSRGVFHRDIKLENILIETSSDVPRARLIDFGCGTLLSETMYTTKQGTYDYTSPEWFLEGRYRAEPTTVWQLGVALFGMLHGSLPFRRSNEMINNNPDVNDSLSFDCKGFLQSCLAKSPEARPTLEMLQRNPWLNQTEPPRSTEGPPAFLCPESTLL